MSKAFKYSKGDFKKVCKYNLNITKYYSYLKTVAFPRGNRGNVPPVET